MNKTPQFHGSDLEKIEMYYGIPKEEIVSFGANVNPLGVSPAMNDFLCQHIHCLERYPDRDYKDLRTAIGSYLSVDPDYILPGNGCTELISLFMKVYHPSHGCIIGPTYSEYERAISIAGGNCIEYLLPEENQFFLDVDAFLEFLPSDTDLVVLCNPNNPTASALTTEQLSQLLSSLKKRSCILLVDETYAEFAPVDVPVSACELTAQYDNLMILRGTSKFFAVPGMRLGYALCSNRELLQKIKHDQDPWSVNSIAEAGAPHMFSDQNYILRTRQLIQSERGRMILELKKYPVLQVFPSYSNFILVKIKDPAITSSMIFEACIKKGLMIRDCSSFHGMESRYIRFCIMLPEHNDRLLEAIKEFLTEVYNKK